MSELQDSKIKLMQNNISGLQGTLKLKKRELEQMKEWAKEKKQRQIQENNQTTLLKLEMPSAYTVPVIVADTSLSDTQTNKHEGIFLQYSSVFKCVFATTNYIYNISEWIVEWVDDEWIDG